MRHETMAQVGKHGAVGMGYWLNGGWVGGGQPMPITYEGQHSIWKGPQRQPGIGGRLAMYARRRQAARVRVARAMLNVGIQPADPLSACNFNPGKLHCARGTIPKRSAYSDQWGRQLYCCMPAPITSKLPGG